ncbi:hypothetical protein [Gloeobacter violaceus]|nr:hypothetical protein [Gloeobacter violaceus]
MLTAAWLGELWVVGSTRTRIETDGLNLTISQRFWNLLPYKKTRGRLVDVRSRQQADIIFGRDKFVWRFWGEEKKFTLFLSPVEQEWLQKEIRTWIEDK